MYDSMVHWTCMLLYIAWQHSSYRHGVAGVLPSIDNIRVKCGKKTLITNRVDGTSTPQMVEIGIQQ